MSSRMPRDEATRLVEAVLRRLDAPTPYLRRISRAVVYGSYARGALDVGDVDLAIDYEGGADMFDRRAIDAATAQLASALRAIEAVAPALAGDGRARARNLADDAVRLRRRLRRDLPPPTWALYDVLRQPAVTGVARVIADDELATLEADLTAASRNFDQALDVRIPYPADTPSLGPPKNLKRMIDELSGGDDRLSIYYFGADMPHDRAMEKPDGFWTWRLLWERGDSLACALGRLHSIHPDPSAGGAPRSGTAGPGLKP